MTRIVCLTLLLLVLFLTSTSARAQCTAFNNSSAHEGDLNTGGPFCGNTGAGCTQCIDWNPAPGVFFSVCYYDWGGIYCYYYSYEYQGF